MKISFIRFVSLIMDTNHGKNIRWNFRVFYIIFRLIKYELYQNKSLTGIFRTLTLEIINLPKTNLTAYLS